MHPNAKEILLAINIIYLNIKVSVKKIIVALVFGINSGTIYRAMAFINQNKTLLFQIVIPVSKIWYLGTIIFFLIFVL